MRDGVAEYRTEQMLVVQGCVGVAEVNGQLLSPLIRRSVHLGLERHVSFTHVNGEGSRCC